MLLKNFLYEKLDFSEETREVLERCFGYVEHNRLKEEYNEEKLLR